MLAATARRRREVGRADADACSPILREAGVVDSGGQGLYRLFQGALLHLVGQAPAGAARDRATRRGPKAVDARSPTPTRASATRRCSCSSPNGVGPLDVDAIRDHLEIDRRVGARRRRRAGAQGPRPQRAAGPRHRLRAGARRRSAGSASRTSTTRRATSARRRRRRSRPARCDSRRRRPLPTRRAPAEPTAADRAPASAVVAVVAGDGLAAIFRDFGVAAGRPAAASRRTRAPASCSRRSTAVDAARGHRPAQQPERRPRRAPGRDSMTDRPVVVVPTRNAAEGFAALLALDPEPGRRGQRRPDDRGRPRRSRRLVVTEAVRDATIGGRKVKRGQTIALDPDDGLVAVDGDREKARARGGRGARRRASSCSRCSTATAPTWPRPRRWPRRIGATSRRRRGRGPPRRPAVLPVPDRRRVGVAQGERSRRGPAVRPIRSSCCRPRWRESGLAAGASRCGGPGIKLGFYTVRDLLFHLPRRYDDLREMRKLGELVWVGGRRRSSRPRRRVGDVRVEPSFRGRIAADDRAPRGRHRQHRRDVVRAAVHRAAAARRRARSSCRARSSTSAATLTLDNPEFQVVAEDDGAAPRRPDRAGLPADRRADRDPPPGGDPRGARPGRLRLPGVPAGAIVASGGARADRPGASRRPTTRTSFEGARRGAPPARVRRAARAPARDGRAAPAAGARRGAGDRRRRRRRTPRSARRSSTRSIGAGSASRSS